MNVESTVATSGIRMASVARSAVSAMLADDGLEPLPASLARTWGNTETMEGRLMEGSVQGSTSHERRRPRIYLHDDQQFISIGFEGENDTLLKMPEGWRDRDRAVEWCIAISRMLSDG